MYLKSLELTGFKSFAKKTELGFNTPITAIVGPNGSGKSNIAEAFQFCLGEQSIKSMRGKRTEDLIWNGSPEMGRSNRASVKLLFDNHPQPLLGKRGEGDGRLLDIDFDEVTLERVIYRDASSEYSLNGSQVRLRDIIELLAGAHIGVSGHHIISQGEADRILNANSAGRREMIEDALGLKIYQWKREESERKLERTGENMKQVESLRREIAPHIHFLKKQVEKFEKVKVQKEELRTLYGEYLKREHLYISSARQSIGLEERAPEGELSELERKLAAAKRILETTHGRDAKTKAVIAIEEKLRELRKERETLSRETGRFEGEIAGAERRAKGRVALPGGEAFVPLFELEEIERLVEGVSLTEEVGVLRQLLWKIKGTIGSLIKRYKTKGEGGAESPEAEIAGLLWKKKELEKKLLAITNEEREVSGRERALRADIEKEKDSNRDAEKEVFKIMARQNELRGVLRDLRMRRSELDHLEQDFKRELTEGVLLVGREILEYEKIEVKNENEKALNPQTQAPEDRVKQEERRRIIEKLKIRIEDTGAGGGAEVMKEFEEVTERDTFLARELSDLAQSAETLRELIQELEQKLEEEFRGGIEKINAEFQEFFALMFGGGSASLAVVKRERRVRARLPDGQGTEADEEPSSAQGYGRAMHGTDTELFALAQEKEEAEDGIEINVSLPRKKIKGLMMLSGGERALTSIALLFAMSQVNPPPFLVLDETDAALDEANSKKYGDMVENLSKHSQLVLITHNRETMSRAGVIYGVTMDRSGVSKLLSIRFDEAVAVAK